MLGCDYINLFLLKKLKAWIRISNTECNCEEEMVHNSDFHAAQLRHAIRGRGLI